MFIRISNALPGFLFALPVALALASFPAPQSHAQELAPFKDRLFAYPRILGEKDSGAYVIVDYRERRDIDARDEIPEKRVRSNYVAPGVGKVQRDLIVETPAGNIRHYAVGAATGAKIITVYLHGQGGSRKQGVNDFTFGGNFNRIKNLMARNGGLYLAPDFSDFAEAGASEVSALLQHYLRQSPGAKLFVACGSMGGALCCKLAANKAVAPHLSGLLLLGSYWDDRFFASAAFRARVPVFFGHGGSDKVFPVTRQESFYREIRTRSPGYPVRFVNFRSGTHGTPIRMTDWRQTINWMLSVR